MPPVLESQFNGLLLAARYAFMPNKLQYCGGDHNDQLFQYGAHNISDPLLGPLLREFETMMPYLRLIAEANKIADPFDYRVVEAYWIGNDLLKNITLDRLYWHFVDGLKLKKKLSPEQFTKLMGEIPHDTKPHHSFHVFNLWQRTGHLNSRHTLDTMNDCRIGWGQIMGVIDNQLEILTSDLEVNDNQIILGAPKKKNINYKFSGQGFILNPTIDDWVAFHWGFACDILTQKQKDDLEFYTKYNLKNIKQP